MPVTEPSRSWNDRVRYALPPRLSLSNLASNFGKYTGLALTNFAPLIELPVTEPRAREQQEGKRTCLSHLVILEIHEGRVHHFTA